MDVVKTLSRQPCADSRQRPQSAHARSHTHTHRTPQSAHHPHKSHDEHRQCNPGGGIHFAVLFRFWQFVHQPLWNPFFDSKSFLWWRYMVGGPLRHTTPRLKHQCDRRGPSSSEGPKRSRSAGHIPDLPLLGVFCFSFLDGLFFPIFWLFFSLFSGGGPREPETYDFPIFSYFGPEARNLFCTRPTESQLKMQK